MDPEICANRSPVLQHNQILHFSLCGNEVSYLYEIKIRGVNRLAMPSFHQASSETKVQHIGNSLNVDSNYRFVEGEWSDPEVTNFQCFKTIGRLFGSFCED